MGKTTERESFEGIHCADWLELRTWVYYRDRRRDIHTIALRIVSCSVNHAGLTTLAFEQLAPRMTGVRRLAAALEEKSSVRGHKKETSSTIGSASSLANPKFAVIAQKHLITCSFPKRKSSRALRAGGI